MAFIDTSTTFTAVNTAAHIPTSFRCHLLDLLVVPSTCGLHLFWLSRGGNPED